MSENLDYHCANCSHCHVVRIREEGEEEKYRLRVRCTKGIWTKASGEEKLHKFFTVARRIQTGCSHYQPLGEEDLFLKNLKRELPLRDEIYDMGQEVELPQGRRSSGG